MTSIPAQKDRRRLSLVAILGLLLLFLIIIAIIFVLLQPASTRYSLNDVPVLGDLDVISETQSSGTSQSGMTSSQQTTTAISMQQAPAASNATATASFKESSIAVEYTKGANGGQTKKSYQGPVTITISGTGQADGTAFSDAFYTYTNRKGQAITPTRASAIAMLCINNQPASTFLSSFPAYTASHTYTVTLNAPGGPLTFGICDTETSDNTGSLTIMFS